MQRATNHSRKYNLTRAGSRLARYLDYVESRSTVSPDIWLQMPKAHIQTPEETAWAIQQLMDAGATFPNFRIPEQQDDDRQPPVSPALDNDDHFYDPLDVTGDGYNGDYSDYGAHSPEED